MMSSSFWLSYNRSTILLKLFYLKCIKLYDPWYTYCISHHIHI